MFKHLPRVVHCLRLLRVSLAKMIGHMVKSELCAKWYQKYSGEVRGCTYGERCKFAHDPEELVIAQHVGSLLALR